MPGVGSTVENPRTFSKGRSIIQVSGTRCWVPATWHLGPDTRYRIDAEDRTPSTEDRVRPPENAHTGFASSYPASMEGNIP
jgi:hypothetical protein